MRTLSAYRAGIVFLLAAVPVRGQEPSMTLKASTQKAWRIAVQKYIDVQTAKKVRGEAVAPVFAEVERFAVLDIGPEEAPQLTYDRLSYRVTWKVTLRAAGRTAAPAEVKEAIRKFIIAAAGNAPSAPYEQNDVKPGGALKIEPEFAPPPPIVEPVDILSRVKAIEEELKRLQELREDVRKLAELRQEMKVLRDAIEALRSSRSPGGASPSAPSGSGSTGQSTLVLPGAVFWYNPCHVDAFYCYPSTGYSYVPAYYYYYRVPTVVSAPDVRRLPVEDDKQSSAPGLNGIRARLERVDRLLAGVAGRSETALRSAAAVPEGFSIDLRGKGPRDAETFYVRGTRLYWEGRYGEALANLRAAVALRDLDARYWSFKALAERALGDVTAAASLRKAAALRQQKLPDADDFALALERVQGAERRFLEAPLNVNR